MKYKVGDRVRMADNLFDIKKDDVCTIKRIDDDLFYFLDKEENVGMTKGIFSHLVISEITDEMIDRFKKEKIAWHFKSEQDYEKTLDILCNKELKFYFTKWGFAYNCINYDEHSLYRENFEHYKSDGYEIIEIMKPVYVPSITRFIFDNFIAPQQYKGIDCELLFQQYMQQKKIPDLEKKVENQKVEIKNLHNKINEFQNVLTYEMSYSKTLAKENDELRLWKENRTNLIKTMEVKLRNIKEVINED